jgi:hypothetical protein
MYLSPPPAATAGGIFRPLKLADSRGRIFFLLFLFIYLFVVLGLEFGTVTLSQPFFVMDFFSR